VSPSALKKKKNKKTQKTKQKQAVISPMAK
jgi:hypothetical protein